LQDPSLALAVRTLILNHRKTIVMRAITRTMMAAIAAQTNPVASTHTASAGDVFVLMTISLASSSASKVESDPEIPPGDSDLRSATVGKWNWTSLGAMTCN